MQLKSKLKKVLEKFNKANSVDKSKLESIRLSQEAAERAVRKAVGRKV